MFYDTSSFMKPAPHLRDDRFHALVMLLPRESKRLLARAVLQMPEVKRVLENGLFVVSRGVTPAYILEELTGQAADKGRRAVRGSTFDPVHSRTRSRSATLGSA